MLATEARGLCLLPGNSGGAGMGVSSVVCPAWGAFLGRSQLRMRNSLIPMEPWLAGARGYPDVRVCSASKFTPFPCNPGVK